MIVDSSALIEIIKGQPAVLDCVQALASATPKYLSGANFLEAALVADNLTQRQQEYSLDSLIDEFAIVVVPVSLNQIQIAREAHRRYGRGNDPRARLNFGDCFAYALASERNEPLLFVGDDFTHTDITPALG